MTDYNGRHIWILLFCGALIKVSAPKRNANEEIFKKFCKYSDISVDDVEKRVLRK